MRLTPLGTNGYFPSFGRQTMSLLLLADRQALLLDAGTGVSRLIEPAVAALLAPYEDLDVLVSHYHLDHVVGLSYLPAVWPRGRVRLFGPASPLVDGDPEAAVKQLLAPPLLPPKREPLPARFEVIAVRERELRIGGLELGLWRQNHPGGSIGIRIADDLAYLTDTTVDAANLNRAAGVRLLVHELWSTDEEAGQGRAAGHSSLSAVAEFARAAGVASLMLVHHHPRRDNAEIRAIAERVAELSGVPASTGEEGRVVALP